MEKGKGHLIQNLALSCYHLTATTSATDPKKGRGPGARVGVGGEGGWVGGGGAGGRLGHYEVPMEAVCRNGSPRTHACLTLTPEPATLVMDSALNFLWQRGAGTTHLLPPVSRHFN